MQLPSEQTLSRVAALIAALGCGLLVFEARLPAARWLRRSVAPLLAAAGIFTYYEFFSIPAPAFFHRWEMFHYVLGAKYAPELEYERLYACSAIADADNGHRAEVETRALRDLHDDELIPAASVLRHPERCTQHFAPQRWLNFRRDVALFRELIGDRETWAELHTDHGYNPSPVWTMFGRPLASAVPLDASLLRRLALIDPLLMLAGLALLAWGFGLRVAWLASLFWSTQAPSNFSWTGGAFLRQDWLLLAIAALVLARKRRFAGAGACLAWSALLRLFPLLFFAGALLLAAAELVRRRRIAPELRRFFGGALLSATLLLGASAWSGYGVASYRGFAQHISMHARTPITNHMSLRALLSFAPEQRLAKLNMSDGSATSAWPAARRARLAARRPWLLLSAAVIVLAFARCVWRLRTLWIALALGFPLVMALSDPSAYYYSMVVLIAPLSRARRSIEVMLLGLAAGGQLLMLQMPQIDERYVALSALYLLFACVLIALFSRPLRSENARRAAVRDR
jgi:hypothetical protein